MQPESITEKLKNKLYSSPNKPGVYIFKDKSEKILYIGKASNLKKRVSSYFNRNSEKTNKILELKRKICDFELIITTSEEEALLLENSLIKKNKPRYNIRLKDDKTYPFIKINLNEEFPRVYITRKYSNDGARYFGPYPSPGNIRKTLNFLNKLFPYRSCTKDIDGNDERPCLEFHIKRCIAPCTGYASKESYMKVINELISFLEGNTKNVKKNLEKEMLEQSKLQNFEKAASLRDKIFSISKIEQKQKVIGISNENLDVIGIGKLRDKGCFEVFFIRKGNMIGHHNYIMEGITEENDNQLISKFIEYYYSDNNNIPKSIICPIDPHNKTFIRNWLSNKTNKNITIHTPVKGKKRDLILMANENAVENLNRMNIKIISKTKSIEIGLQQLRDELGLHELPNRIECFDISHLQGSNVVASMSVLVNGIPLKSHYRRFKIKTNLIGNDDYYSMKEVINRRLMRMINKDKDQSFSKKPNLILIDGGKGQLNSVMEVVLELGVENISIASIAKKEERIFLPDFSESILLPKKSNGLFILQKSRDEAHRFAVNYHRNIRSKNTFNSPLDNIEGIGPKKKKLLLKKFGSIQSIKESNIKDLIEIKGINELLAISIKESI